MRRQGESRTGTKSEITGRNRNQSTRALADTDPSATATLQNRLIPMNHAHYDNQPPSSHPPEAPKPRTKPENESLKPIWPTPAPAGKQPPTAHHTKTAEFQRPANNTTIKHRPAISPKHPNHGPNPRAGAENRSSPHERQPTRRHQPPTTPKTAEFQQSAGRTSTNHQSANHTTTRTRRPDRRTHTEIGSSPHRHR